MNKWTLTIEQEDVITFPPDLLEQVGWKEGDTLVWKDNQDGTWSLSKKVLQYSMNDKSNEVMDILQEECAEVIQAVSKVRRFGIDNVKPGKPKTNREHLEEELGDLLAMIDILKEMGVVSETSMAVAKQAKIEKLKKWSKIYEQN